MDGFLHLVVAFVVGLGLALILSVTLRRMMSAEAFARTNYRGHPLPTSMGIVIPLVAVAGVAPDSLRWSAVGTLGVPVVVLVTGFALLGLLDDLAGVGQSGGFRGHVRALLQGDLTSGMVKMLGGPLLAIVVIGQWEVLPSVAHVLRDAAVVALAANLANLLDRAPGRVIKFGLVGFGLVLVGGLRGYLAAPALTMGAAAGLLPGDLREDYMLGDAGSNAIGATVGFAAVASLGSGVRWLLLGALLALNLVSEVLSFSRVIDGTPPLRWFDRLGSPHRDA